MRERVPRLLRTFRVSATLLAAGFFFLALPAACQLPDQFTNLQVLPSDISRDSLVQIMREFSFDLGVRCQYCHTGGDGVSFEGVQFASDEDPDKVKARFMMRMVEQLNSEILPEMAGRDQPTLEMGCKNCHRGLPRPVTLRQTLRAVLDSEGVDAMAAEYRRLRETRMMVGAYDFGEWETNSLAEQLTRENRIEDAIGVYVLNGEFHPESFAIVFTLGQLYERVGNSDAAVASYERALELRPDHEGARERLSELRPG